MKEKVKVKVLTALALISTLIFFAWGTVRVVKSVQFEFNCEAYIKRAADANTVELAKTELEKAMDYAENNNLTEGIVSIFLKNPRNDIGFWYTNMKASYEELDQLPEDATPLEKTNVLMKLRESLTDSDGDDGTTVTIPEGISVYPNNLVYFLWGLLPLLALSVLFILFCIEGAKLEAKKLAQKK